MSDVAASVEAVEEVRPVELSADVLDEMAHLNTVGLAHDFDVLGRATFDVG